MAIDIGANLGSDVTGMRVVIDPSAAQKGADVVNRAFDSMPDHASQSMSKIDQSIRKLRQSLFGLQTAFTGIGVGVMAGEILRADVTMAKIMGTLRTATGSAGMAAVTFKEVKEVSRAMSIDLGTAANAFARLMAATRGTNTEGKATWDLFKGVSAAVTATGGGAYELYLALKAVEQMASKGRIQMEELRGQLGDVLPGAFNETAKSIGKTTGELNRLMKAGLAADDVLPKLGPQLLKDFQDAAKGIGTSVIGVLNRWKTFKLEVLSSVGLGGFAKALHGAMDKFESLLDNPKFMKAAANLGDLLGEAINKVTTAIMYLGNHVEYVKAAFLAFGSIKVIEFFQQLAAAINVVRDSLVALKIAEAGSGLLKPGGGVGPTGGGGGVGPKGGLASLALSFPYLFDANGKPLTQSALNTRVASPSFVQPTINPATSLAMVNMLTGNKGQVLNQSQFTAKYVASDAFKNMGFFERGQFAKMASLVGLNVPLKSQFGALIPDSVKKFFKSEEGAGLTFDNSPFYNSSKVYRSDSDVGQYLKKGKRDYPGQSRLETDIIKDIADSQGLKQSKYGDVTLARPITVFHATTDKAADKILKEGFIPPSARGGYSDLNFFTTQEQAIEYSAMRKPQDGLNHKMAILATTLPKGTKVGYNYGGVDLVTPDVIPPQNVKKLEGLFSFNKNRRNVEDIFSSEGARVVGRKIDGVFKEVENAFDKIRFNITSRIPNKLKSTEVADFLTTKPAGPRVGLFTRDSQLLTQVQLNARTAGKAFEELGVGERLAIKNLAELNGLSISWGKVVGGIVPTAKNFADVVLSKKTWASAVEGVTTFGQSFVKSTKDLPTILNDLTRTGWVKMAAKSQDTFTSIEKLAGKSFSLLKTAGSGAWSGIKAGAGLADRAILTVGTKLGGVIESLVGIAAANPFLALAAAAAATYITYDTFRDKLISIDGHTAQLQDHVHAWGDTLNAMFQDMIGNLDSIIDKMGKIKAPTGPKGATIEGDTKYLAGLGGKLFGNLATAGTLTNPFGFNFGPYVKGGLLGTSAATAERQSIFDRAASSQGNIDPITGLPRKNLLGVPDFYDKYPRTPRTLNKDTGLPEMDEIQKAVAELKQKIKVDEEIFKTMTEGPDLLGKNAPAIVMLEAEKSARARLAGYNLGASQAPSTGGGARKAVYSPDRGLGKEFIDLTKFEAAKTAAITSADQLSNLVNTLKEENEVQEAVNKVMDQGAYAVERERAAKEHSIQINKLLNGLTDESKDKLKPYIEELNKEKQLSIDLAVTERIRGDAMKANLELPWTQFVATQRDLKAQQKEGLSPAAYWIASTRAAEQYKNSLDEMLMSTKKFSAGAFVAFRQYAQYAQDAAVQAHEFISNSLRSLEDALTQAFRFKGLSGFKNMFNQMLDDYQRMIVRRTITGPLSNYFSKKFGIDLGLVKADGSKDAPFYVRDIDKMIGPGGLGGAPQVDENGKPTGWIGILAKILGFGYGKKLPIAGSNPDLPLGINGGVTPTWNPDPLSGNGPLQQAHDSIKVLTKGNISLLDRISHGWMTIIGGVGKGFGALLNGLGGILAKIFGGGGGGLGSILLNFGLGVLKGTLGGIHGAGGGGVSGASAAGSVTNVSGSYGFANGGIMTPLGKVKLNAYSGGGIAYSPQMALFGEGRRPEAYVPLPDGRRIPVALMGSFGGSASTRAMNVHVMHDGTTGIHVQQIDEDTIRIWARQEAVQTVETHGPRTIANELYNPNSRVSKAITQSKETRERR